MYLEAVFHRLFENKRVLVAGMGREGRSAVALLERLGVCAELQTADNNDAIRESLATKKFDMVVKSPGVPMRILADLCAKTEITSMTDIFLRVYGDQVVGVTGTKGKSTTTTLIYNIMKAAGYRVLLGGNIGIPLFELIDSIDLSTIVVAELSCHQLQGIHRAPHIGVLLNLFEEHLDHYDGYDDYMAAKMQIGLRQADGDYFVYCTDNADLSRMVEANRKGFRSQVIGYSATDEPLYEDVVTRLAGEHNKSNIKAAAHVAKLYCVDDDTFRNAVAGFEGLEHRLEFVGTYEGIRFYNDSISTIPAACQSALQSIDGVQTLILGGFDRNIDYSGFMDFVTDSKVEYIAFVGAAGARMKSDLENRHPDHGKQILESDDYVNIVDWCFEVTETGKACLLSPAAASYDGFKNFEERGHTFKSLVRCHARHELHQHPGLSACEVFAHELIVKSLQAYPDCKIFQHVGGQQSAVGGQTTPLLNQSNNQAISYGVVAVFGKKADAPTVALRADTDALPINESENPYCSLSAGVSHKCGHDGHTAIMLRVADMIAQNPKLYTDKNIMLVFQPEEETGHGSQKILDSGIMQQYDIRAVYGLHNIPGVPIGDVLVASGTFAAASVGVKYTMTGRQTHASTPEKGVNPGLAVAESIECLTRLNSTNANSTDEFTQATLICVRLGEEAYGTSAGNAEVMFTLRAFSNQNMARLRDKANNMVAEICERHGLQLSISESDPFNATENNPNLAARMKDRFAQSGLTVHELERPFRWSEDFANYLMQYPGVFFGIGSGENCHELHHPQYSFPDELIEPAAKTLLQVLSWEY